MLQNSILRLAVGIPGAAVVVFGLYHFMMAMLGDDYQVPEETANAAITAIPMPSREDPDMRESTPKPEKLDLADRSPSQPAYAASAGDINLPSPAFSGAVPQSLDVGRLSALSLRPEPIPGRDAQPLTPPSVTYPQGLAGRGVEGSCEVRLDVGVRGRPYNVEASCSHAGFEREAERAVKRVMFAPEIVDGQARARQNVVYPIEFRLEDG